MVPLGEVLGEKTPICTEEMLKQKEWFEEKNIGGIMEKNIAIKVIDLGSYLNENREFDDKTFEEEIARQGEVVVVIMAFCYSYNSILKTVQTSVGQSAQIMLRWDRALIRGALHNFSSFTVCQQKGGSHEGSDELLSEKSQLEIGWA